MDRGRINLTDLANGDDAPVGASVTRRGIMAGMGAAAASLPLTALAQAPAGGDVVFRVIRKGSPMGWLQTTFARAGDRLTARTKLELSVSLVGIRVFRYLHTSEEVWQGSNLVSVASETDNDGTPFRVKATLAGDSLRIEGPQGTVTAPTATLTTNCAWNPGFVRQSMLLDCERGRYVPVTVEPLGGKTLTVLGAQRAAMGYRTTLPHAAGEVWYAGDEWVHGVFVTKGETLTYERNR